MKAIVESIKLDGGFAFGVAILLRTIRVVILGRGK